MNILVTGANSFIGRALCKKMLADGWWVRGAVRSAAQMTALPSGVEGALVGNIGPETDWSDALSGIEGIVHLAARVHMTNDTASDPLTKFRYVNVAATERLAQMAAASGCRRFVFMSSIKVNGERTEDRGQGAVVRSQEKTEVRGQKSEVRGQEKTEVRGQKSEVRGQEKPEVRGQKSEVRSQEKPEVRGQKSEVRGQKSEVRGQEKTEVRGQKSEVRGQEKTEVRGQKQRAEGRGQEGELKEFFSEEDVPEPQDPYVVSKWEAEQVLHEIAEATGLEVVVLRPPLVYGPGVKANFLRLMRSVARGVPFPLANVNNRRSLIYIENLVDKETAKWYLKRRNISRKGAKTLR